MKFSEALRLGAMAIPAIHGPTFRRVGGKVCGACAMGTAMLAAGFGDDMSFLDRAIVERWPYLMNRVTIPTPQGGESDLRGTIVYLFESKRWTREAIADWVETIEAQQPIDQPEECEASK